MTVDQVPGTEHVFIDPMVNPELVNRVAASLNEDEVSKPVLIAAPPDGTVTLPGGLLRPDKTIVRDAVVRELTGEDEEELAKPVYAKDFIRLMDTLLNRCVESIGGQPADREMLDQLLIGDRDALLQAIRVATYGDAMRMSLNCPLCEHKFRIEYQFSNDVTMRQLAGHVVELDDGEIKIELDADERLYNVPLRKGGYALVELITGGAQRHVYTAENASLTSAERNTLLLQQCVRSVRGDAPFPHDIRQMGSGDRMRILQFLGSAQPGPQWGEVKQSCPACDREFPLVIDVPTMFQSL